ncbi:hypothetical protein [Nostoc sp. NMS8]|uniref:hypothetical protein n=1 Tax=Nostoc sp. NMS8 TaxID=2815392 RepID=UPI0026003EBE|nr:hypothetical protein [Nostoc sp. NMS8]MBN3963530.1 hypothetical protein [Nostoc sp. NMS8]
MFQTINDQKPVIAFAFGVPTGYEAKRNEAIAKSLRLQLLETLRERYTPFRTLRERQGRTQ